MGLYIYQGSKIYKVATRPTINDDDDDDDDNNNFLQENLYFIQPDDWAFDSE